MKLLELIPQLASIDSELTIFAKGLPIDVSSEVVIQREAFDSVEDGLIYLLEVEIAQEVLEVWSEWRNGIQPTDEEAAEAIIYYAIKDAFQPVEELE